MADPSGENSHLKEDDYDNAQVHLTGAELKALVDNAVKAALDRQYEEYTESRSRTISKPHSKPKTHSKSHSKLLSKPKKDDDNHSSNENSVRQERVYTDASRARGCPTSILYHANPETSLGRKVRSIV